MTIFEAEQNPRSDTMSQKINNSECPNQSLPQKPKLL